MGFVKLSNRHLQIDAGTVKELFPATTHIQMVYYQAKKTMLLADSSDEIFRSLHKSVVLLMKDKNLQGDKSISLEELIIDQDLNDTDRELEFQGDKTMRILNIYW